MRTCPECQKPMTPTKRKFAEIEVCDGCKGVFLEAGESLAVYGPEAEVRFLVEDGRARRLHPSGRRCPAGHGTMTIVSVRTSTGQVEVDVCDECGGVYFDAGEGEALGSIETARPGTFQEPSRMSAHDLAIDDARRSGESFFERFVADFVSGRGRRRE